MSAPAIKAERLRVNRFLPYGRQVIEEDDIAAVAEAMRGELLTTGPYVRRFETALAKTVGANAARTSPLASASLVFSPSALYVVTVCPLSASTRDVAVRNNSRTLSDAVDSSFCAFPENAPRASLLACDDRGVWWLAW